MKTKKFTKVSKGNKNLYWSLTNGFLLSTLENKPMGWKAVYKDNKGYFTFEGIKFEYWEYLTFNSEIISFKSYSPAPFDGITHPKFKKRPI